MTPIVSTVPSSPVVSGFAAWRDRFRADPRIPFACIHTFYAVLGCTLLGFNRSPLQMIATVAVCCVLEVLFSLLFRRKAVVPLSAYITGVGVCLLLNYAHNVWMLFPPVFLAIASKYLFTFRDRHFFNPSLFGIVGALWFGSGMYASAPAYQWGGSIALMAFMVTAALVLFVFKIDRAPLVVAFLGFFAVQLAVRGYVVRWHVDASTLWLGTFSSPSFYLFTFFMITDPKTSPSGRGAQVAWAAGIVALDLWFHTRLSLSTFFFALFWLSAGRGLWLHVREIVRVGLRDYVVSVPWRRVTFRWGVVIASGAIGWGAYRAFILPCAQITPTFRFESVPPERSGIDPKLSPIMNEIDPRIRHFAKWIMSVGDAVAVGDFDGDGRQDIFLTNTLKRPEDRCALYRNLGDFRFERVPLPCLDDILRHPEIHGMPACALFCDYDNSGRKSLFVGMAYGKSRLLKNIPGPDGRPEFVDATDTCGIAAHTTCVAATFFDYDNDGKPDLFIANSLTPYLPGYDKPEPLNIFRLPQPAYPGDRRMFHFMHESWNNARNGGLNLLFHNNGDGTFTRMDSAAMGLPETGISLAVGTAHYNHDGWPDLYVANDFGPDDLYLNDRGRRFVRISGGTFGSIGRDTYKGMNVSIGDIANDGEQATYVSNVHVPLQAEGSLLWTVQPNPDDPFRPVFTDEATIQGALNDGGFGWGAGMGDLDLDGWLDIVQVNGMVDASPDARFAKTEPYWYLAEKVMRSGPEIHAYADKWPDLRGYDIFGKQAYRVYLSRGNHRRARFVDVAQRVGLTEMTNARGVALVDLNDDGRLDSVITHQFTAPSIFKNVATGVSPARAWIGLLLRGDGVTVNRDALGVTVRATSIRDGNPFVQTREVRGTGGFSAQGDERLLFGFGSDESPVEIEILWRSGDRSVLKNLAKNTYHTVDCTAVPHVP